MLLDKTHKNVFFSFPKRAVQSLDMLECTNGLQCKTLSDAVSTDDRCSVSERQESSGAEGGDSSKSSCQPRAQLCSAVKE